MIKRLVMPCIILCLPAVSATAAQTEGTSVLPESNPTTINQAYVSSETLARFEQDHGTTMARVESNYGAPNVQLAAVGTPPITRWVYDSFTVYFEDDRVIHSVGHPPQANEQQ